MDVGQNYLYTSDVSVGCTSDKIIIFFFFLISESKHFTDNKTCLWPQYLDCNVYFIYHYYASNFKEAEGVYCFWVVSLSIHHAF